MKYFFNTKFSDNGLNKPIYLLSIGIVAEDGRELYYQLNYDKYPEVSDWIARNIFPGLVHFDIGKQQRSCTNVKTNDEPSRKPCRLFNECQWIDQYSLRKSIERFISVDNDMHELCGYNCSYDSVLLFQLFGGSTDYFPEIFKYCFDLN